MSRTDPEYGHLVPLLEEYAELERLGHRNLDDIEATIGRYDVACGWARGGQLTVATRPHEVAGLEPETPGFLGREATRALVDSPSTR